jgi:hypothetical protein
LRPRGYHVAKLSPAERKQLERELLTTQDAVLARRYGLVRDRVRQIRAELGYPSSQVLRHKLTLRAQAERRERRQIEREHRQQQQRKAELIAMNQLSRRWKSGTTIRELAKEYGLVWGCLNSRIVRWRQRYPQKFPYRLPPPPRSKTI